MRRKMRYCGSKEVATSSIRESASREKRPQPKLKVRLVRRCWPLAVVSVSLMPLSNVRASTAQGQRDRTVWDGVYSTVQASRGKEAFDIHCAHCHGTDLAGGDGPSLLGSAFMQNWTEDSVGSLFAKIQTSMPGDARATLSADTNIDIVAYLLQQNGFPAGSTELAPRADVLGGILIQGRGGPAPVPNFAMVEVFGCLSTGSNAWVLTRATEPVRARRRPRTFDPGLQGPTSLGTLTISLLDVPQDPAADLGRMMRAQGLLIRQPDQLKLNVTALQATEFSCTQ
jgi:mono/diheme cytochrome c family protein